MSKGTLLSVACRSTYLDNMLDYLGDRDEKCNSGRNSDYMRVNFLLLAMGRQMLVGIGGRSIAVFLKATASVNPKHVRVTTTMEPREWVEDLDEDICRLASTS